MIYEVLRIHNFDANCTTLNFNKDTFKFMELSITSKLESPDASIDSAHGSIRDIKYRGLSFNVSLFSLKSFLRNIGLQS